MDSGSFADRLGTAFTICTLDLACGRVWAAADPISVDWSAECGPVDVETWGEPLLNFEWVGPGRSWSMSLDVVDVGRAGAFIVLRESHRSPRVIAALVARNHAALLSAFFRSLVDRNGGAYGVPLFGRLPLRTLNYRPELVGAETIEQCYLDWMDWAAAVGSDPWVELEGQMLETQPESNDHADAPAAHWHRAAIEPLGGTGKSTMLASCSVARRLLFRMYFLLSYSERSPGRSAGPRG